MPRAHVERDAPFEPASCAVPDVGCIVVGIEQRQQLPPDAVADLLLAVWSSASVTSSSDRIFTLAPDRYICMLS